MTGRPPTAASAATGEWLLTGLRPDTDYLSEILPGMALVGAGMGCVLTPAFELTTRTVEPRLAGLVAAVTNTSTQLGATIGTAVLNTIAIGATADAIRSGASPLDAFVDGLEPRDPSRLSAGDGRPGTRSP